MQFNTINKTLLQEDHKGAILKQLGNLGIRNGRIGFLVEEKVSVQEMKKILTFLFYRIR